MTDRPNYEHAQGPAESVAAELPTADQVLLAAESTALDEPRDDTEVLWLHQMFFWMALAVIGASFLLRSEGQEAVFLPGAKSAMPEICATKRIFDLPCPGCGLTRSFVSISHGQFSRAWSFNPIGFLLYPFIFIQIPWNAMQFLLIRKRGYSLHLPYMHLIPVAIAALMMLRWLTLVPQMF